jgi:copper chaperone
MITYRVDDMTCGHCVATVTQAVAAVDAAARVQIDLAQHRVDVEPAAATPQQIRQAIEDAGYTPQEVA